MLSDDLLAALRAAGQGPVGFAPVRNEMLRVRQWLSHYRAVGIARFFVVDNGSTDGTFEFLDAQPDVFAVRSDESFLQSNTGAAWLSELHRKLPGGTWVMFADADELLVYRGWPRRPLSDLLDEVEHEGANAVFAFMLDMYPDGPLESVADAGNASLPEMAPCFDRDYAFRNPPARPWQAPYRAVEVLGGPRLRLLSSLERERRTTWMHYLVRGQMDRLIPATPDALLPLLVRLMPRQMPALAKFPLVQSGHGIDYANVHTIRGARIFRENAVLLHYKFLGDFARRVESECIRHEHYRRGTEYMMYAQILQRYGHLDLRYSGTHWFSGTEQLVELSLIRDIGALVSDPGASWDGACSRKKAA